MPSYEYHCSKCDKPFILTQRLAEHNTKKVHCPTCKSTQVRQILSSFFAQTAKKS